VIKHDTMTFDKIFHIPERNIGIILYEFPLIAQHDEYACQHSQADNLYRRVEYKPGWETFMFSAVALVLFHNPFCFMFFCHGFQNRLSIKDLSLSYDVQSMVKFRSDRMMFFRTVYGYQSVA